MYDARLALLSLPKPPPVLKPGATGWAVRLLARLLAQAGYAERIWADAEEPAPEVYDGRLVAASTIYQAAMKLKPDHVIGSETWAWLGCAPTLTPAEIALRYARIEAYTPAREIGGNNRGPFVHKYMNGREGKQWAWCAGFATWCWLQSTPGWFPQARFSSSGIVRDARHARRLYHVNGSFGAQRSAPQPGDLGIVPGGPTGYRHTTIYQRTDGDLAYVWEGNVRPRKWVPWQYDVVRMGSYALSSLVFVRMS